jgi:hypothetical protein
MRRAVFFGGGLAVVVASVSFTALFGSADSRPPPTSRFAAQSESNECIEAAHGDVPVGSDGSVAGGFASPGEAIRALFPEAENLPQRQVAADRVLFERFDNGRKVAA